MTASNVCSVCFTDMVRCICSRRTGAVLGPPPGLQDNKFLRGTNHSDLDQDMLEDNTSEDATEMHQVATLRVTDSSETLVNDSRATIKKMVERLGNVGINASRTRLPVKTDADYECNDRDVFEFLCIVLGSWLQSS